MDKFSLRILGTRAETEAHRGYIRNAEGGRKDYDPLIEAVFKHQAASYDASAALKASKSTDNDIILSSFFYTHCYCNVTLRKGDGEGRVVSTEEFANDVFLKKQNEGRNNLSYLLGQVGVGKTAFINYLISNYGTHWVRNSIWFIRIDAELAGDGKKLTIVKFIDTISQKTIKVLRTHPELLKTPEGNSSEYCRTELDKLIAATRLPIDSLSVDAQGDRHQKQLSAFEALVRKISDDCRRRLCIVVDNLDFLVHTSDRALYQSDTPFEDEETLTTTCSIVRLFINHTHQLGSLGVNILFVMRSDTFHVLSETGRTSLLEDSAWQGKNAFTIEKPDWQAVLKSRGKLLEFVAERENSPSRKKAYIKLIDLILNDLYSEPDHQSTMIEHLEKLTNYGLREMIKFFAQYSWIGDKNAVDGTSVLERFSEQYPIALITFMLSGRRRFSQFKSYFPNIYLINASFEHAHTYWLKWLIIAFLHKKSATGEHTAPENIISIFSGTTNKGYEPKLIKECLGSLSEANFSNMIQVIRSRDQQNKLVIDKICLTERGRHCFSSVFDRFFYLQLVVDDPLLPIPTILMDEFNFRSKVDYGYIIDCDTASFHEGAKHMIELKAKQVLFLLQVLTRSLEYERTQYKEVFDELEHHKVTMPNTHVINRMIVSELEKLSSSALVAFDLERILQEVGKMPNHIQVAMEYLYGPRYK